MLPRLEARASAWVVFDLALGKSPSSKKLFPMLPRVFSSVRRACRKRAIASVSLKRSIASSKRSSFIATNPRLPSALASRNACLCCRAKVSACTKYCWANASLCSRWRQVPWFSATSPIESGFPVTARRSASSIRRSPSANLLSRQSARD